MTLRRRSLIGKLLRFSEAPALYLPTAKEGNVLRSVCLSTGEGGWADPL